MRLRPVTPPRRPTYSKGPLIPTVPHVDAPPLDNDRPTLDALPVGLNPASAWEAGQGSILVFEIVVACLAALVAGFLDAIAGGGGIISVPVLLMLGVPVTTALGTNKIQSTAGTTMALITYLRRGAVVPEIAWRAAPLSALGGILGAATLLLVPSDFLKPLITLLVCGLAIYLCLKPNFGATARYQGLSRTLLWIILSCAFGIGFYDGFFGPGTGMFLTYLLVRVVELDFVRAAGTTKAINLASNITPLIYFITHDSIRYDLGIPMALANILGGYLGARSAIKGGPSLVRWISILMASGLALKFIYELSAA